jgi:hypothetical protein
VRGPEGQERQASIQRSDSTTASTGERGRSGSRVPFTRLDTPSHHQPISRRQHASFHHRIGGLDAQIEPVEGCPDQ